MSSNLSIGIVGLPNVGKSTTFNALTNNDILAANYPFATIEPNTGIVPVPNPRLEILAKMYNSNKILPSTVTFVDIAGLVKGASKGEGLGNKFLANIRQCNAIVHIVRAFDNSEILRHDESPVNPKDDIEIINTELILADIQTIESRLPRIQKEAKANPKIRSDIIYLESLLSSLKSGIPLSSLNSIKHDAIKDLHLLTAKPVIYVFNVDENGLTDTELQKKMQNLVEPAKSLFLSAKLEEELKGRAWTIHKGWTAPKAAGVIHTDFERGFIAAQVVSYDDLIKAGSEAAAKAAGKIRTEGKDYVMQPNDVVEFRWNEDRGVWVQYDHR